MPLFIGGRPTEGGFESEFDAFIGILSVLDEPFSRDARLVDKEGIVKHVEGLQSYGAGAALTNGEVDIPEIE